MTEGPAHELVEEASAPAAPVSVAALAGSSVVCAATSCAILGPVGVEHAFAASVWMGAAVFAAGGFFALLDGRRHRPRPLSLPRARARRRRL